MKNYILCHFFTLFAAIAIGQEVRHSVVYDDPDKENLAISIDYFTADFALGNEDKNIDAVGALGFGIQLNYMNLYDRLTIDLAFRRNYGLFGDLPSTFLNSGITWDLSTKTVKTTTQFELTNLSNNRVLVMKGVKLSQTNRFRARAGLTYTKAFMLMPYKISHVASRAAVPAFGIYSGLEYSHNVNFKTNVMGYGMRKDQTLFRFYADVIFTPIGGYGDSLVASKVTFAANQAITDDIKHELDSIGVKRNLGGIVGVKYIFSFPKINFNCDANIGYKPPYQGFYTYVGTGITINIATEFQKNTAAKRED